ncbi:MAG: DUF599 family protein [Granulosicoccus sp.]|nr:DUF599 family protein [Granulosicoccus sp.]
MHNYHGFTLLDAVALLFFTTIWGSHYYTINRSRYKDRTITTAMKTMRGRWMANVVQRRESPKDAIIQNALQQGVLFFASTTVLLIGGLAAALGAAERAVGVLSELPLSTTSTAFQWHVKVLLVLLIFIFAFFKFAWSYRLYNYVLIMIGASPEGPEPVDRNAQEQHAKKLTMAHALAAKHFTTGLNSYFFALAAISWFLNAWLFIVATIWVVLVLYRRAFRSEFLKIVRMDEY